MKEKRPRKTEGKKKRKHGHNRQMSAAPASPRKSKDIHGGKRGCRRRRGTRGRIAVKNGMRVLFNKRGVHQRKKESHLKTQPGKKKRASRIGKIDRKKVKIAERGNSSKKKGRKSGNDTPAE